MGTHWSVKLVIASDSEQQAFQSISGDLIQQQIQNSLDSVEQAMSNWLEDSDISRFNRLPNGCMLVSEHTDRVASTAVDISLASGQLFDPTVSPLIELWGFGVAESSALPTTPNPTQITSALEHVGANRWSRTELQLCKSIDQLQLNLSAIAKGYAVDEVAALLSGQGFGNFLVDVGGELSAMGQNADNQFWNVGIEKPAAGFGGALQSSLRLKNIGIATSGDYRNYVELDGVHYSHIIDPKTGYPVRHDLVSVTVLHASVMVADAWATALLVAGAEQGLKLAEQQQLAVYMVRNPKGTSEFSALASSSWERYQATLESTHY